MRFNMMLIHAIPYILHQIRQADICVVFMLMISQDMMSFSQYDTIILSTLFYFITQHQCTFYIVYADYV